MAFTNNRNEFVRALRHLSIQSRVVEQNPGLQTRTHRVIVTRFHCQHEPVEKFDDRNAIRDGVARLRQSISRIGREAHIVSSANEGNSFSFRTCQNHDRTTQQHNGSYDAHRG